MMSHVVNMDVMGLFQGIMSLYDFIKGKKGGGGSLTPSSIVVPASNLLCVV